jgi:hypothetical protein
MSTLRSVNRTCDSGGGLGSKLAARTTSDDHHQQHNAVRVHDPAGASAKLACADCFGVVVLMWPSNAVSHATCAVLVSVWQHRTLVHPTRGERRVCARRAPRFTQVYSRWSTMKAPLLACDTIEAFGAASSPRVRNTITWDTD